MPRPSQTSERRRELLPIVARAFADLGYRRATTAAIAERCGVQETILYRLWPDKKAMFIAAIGYVYDLSVEIWTKALAAGGGSGSPAERLLAYEAKHMGQFGHHRIIFAGLNEADDPEIRTALASMYRRYQRYVRDLVLGHAGGRRGRSRAAVDAEAAAIAWGLIGLGTVSNICADLGLLGDAERGRLMRGVGALLLDGTAPS